MEHIIEKHQKLMESKALYEAEEAEFNSLVHSYARMNARFKPEQRIWDKIKNEGMYIEGISGVFSQRRNKVLIMYVGKKLTAKGNVDNRSVKRVYEDAADAIDIYRKHD